MHTATRSLLLALVFLGLAGTASAHAVVSPDTATAGEYQTFILGVPSERDLPTTAVALDIPSGLDHVTPIVKPGWTISLTKDDADNVTRIEWAGGSIPAEFKDQFSFTAHVPAKPTTLAWKAYQTYQDGQVVAWDQDPGAEDSENPYSRTQILAATDGGKGNGRDEDGVLPYALSLAALALSVFSLARVRKLETSG